MSPEPMSHKLMSHEPISHEPMSNEPMRHKLMSLEPMNNKPLKLKCLESLMLYESDNHKAGSLNHFAIPLPVTN